MTSPANTIRHESNFVCATYGVLTASIVDGVTSYQQMDWLAHHLQANGKLHPGGTALLFIIRETAKLPEPPVRKRVDDMLIEMHVTVKLMAAVIEGTGFVAATKRSVFATQTVPVLGKTTVKVFADRIVACEWLAAESATGKLALPSANELISFGLGLPTTEPTGV